jgi:glycosyltransferase involved in cell wall biosynthesis
MSKPSVIMFNRVYPPVRGATGRVMRDLARGLAADGWHVTVVTTGPKAAKERDGAVRIVRIKANTRPRTILSYALIWARLLLTGLRMKRRDLVITLTDPPLLVVAGQMIARARGSRHMHWCHDMYPDLLPALGVNPPEFIVRRLRAAAAQAMAQCDKVIVIGRCMARRMIRNGVEARRISIIPNWPDRELVSPTRRLRAANSNTLPKELFANSGPKFRVLYSGTMGKAHPLDTVIEAARILNSQHPEIEFVFVGEGQGLDKLVKARDRQGLENIRLIPWQPVSRLRDLMESGDLHLISMVPEAAGMLVPCKLYSAFAVGRPCVFVGPSHCEAARTIIDFNAGSVVAQGEAELLAETIRRYRMDSDVWFTAHEGAVAAGKVYLPDEAIGAWVRRARAVLHLPKVKKAVKPAKTARTAFNDRRKAA